MLLVQKLLKDRYADTLTSKVIDVKQICATPLGLQFASIHITYVRICYCVVLRINSVKILCMLLSQLQLIPVLMYNILYRYTIYTRYKWFIQIIRLENNFKLIITRIERKSTDRESEVYMVIIITIG